MKKLSMLALKDDAVRNLDPWVKSKRRLVMKSAKLIAAVVCIVSFAAGVSEASVLITPTDVTASSVLSTSFLAGNLIDDSGLSGTDPHAITDTHAAVSSSAKNSWASVVGTVESPTLPATLVFDLGGTFDVTDLHIWQYAFNPVSGNTNNSKDITVEFSTGGVAGTFGSGVNIQLTQWTAVEAAQNFAVTPVSANAVRFTITTLHAGVVAGLGEVKFSVVPEPHSLAISAICLLGLGMVRRRRNRRS
jgi:hypothetical protein